MRRIETKRALAAFALVSSGLACLLSSCKVGDALEDLSGSSSTNHQQASASASPSSPGQSVPPSPTPSAPGGTLSPGAVAARSTSPSFVHSLQMPQVPDLLFATMPSGAANLDAVCSQPGTDGLTSTTAMCATPRPTVQSLEDLMAVLKLSFVPGGGNGTGGNPAFVLLGHSASLVTKSVSSINPRAIIFTPNITQPNPAQPYTFLSFTRGDEFAEVATYDPVNRVVNMYVVAFKKACNQTATCTAADLLTPEVEKNWTEVSIFEDDSATDPLGNTVLDCQQCHQMQGPNGAPILRMQENTAPFTHFFSQSTAGGQALLHDYLAAHTQTDEAYAGIPGNLIALSNPQLFAAAVANAGFPSQPNAFPSATIEAEVNASNSAQPGDDTVSGKSPTWTVLYQNYVNGAAIPPPYHDVKITDPTKLAYMSDIYAKVLAGSVPSSSLPDIRDVMKDDALFLSSAGFAPEIGLTPSDLLINACAQCHNPHLDQARSRAKFDATEVDAMSKSELQTAITRINLPAGSLQLMPPSMFRALSAEDKTALTTFLSEAASRAP